MLTYLILYIQDVLGLSAIGTGVRFLPLTGAIFVAAGIAGRLTSEVPVGSMIGAGFVLIGAGLLLMRGLTPASSWTHLLPGMIVSGIGAGFVNVPLAATAVGVVEPARAGMASGINSTFRQVGIATGIAVLGTVFASRLHSDIVARLSGTALGTQAHAIAAGAGSGHAAQTLASLPAPLRGVAAGATRAGFVDGLNLILLIGVVICFAGAVLSFALIRQRDFVASGESGLAPEAAEEAEPAVCFGDCPAA